MTKDFSPFLLPELKNEAPWTLFSVTNYIDTKLNNRTNVPQYEGNFWRWQNRNRERYDSGCNIRNRSGPVSNHLSQSLITFGRAVVSRDIKEDSVTAPTMWDTYEGILSLVFPPCSTSHLHKSTQTIAPSHEYKAVTDSDLLEIILTLLKLKHWYNYHANLAHQYFKTLNVIINCINPPPPQMKLYQSNFPWQHQQLHPPSDYKSGYYIP